MSFHKNLRGNDLHAPSSELVENNTGSTISKLKVVDLNGMGTAYPQVVLGNPSLLANFGVAQYDIPTGKFGYITCLGFMFEIDTSAWPVGTVLYSSSTGDLQSTINGSPVALVVKQDATYGVLYVTADLAGQTAIMNWQLIGNTGTNPSTDFLGTTDSQPLIIKTNNTFAAKVDAQGRIGLGEQNPDEFLVVKAHPNMPGSGHRQTTYSLTTSDTNWNLAYAYTLPLHSVLQMTATAIGYNTTTLSRSSFKKTATAWRETSIAVLAGPVQSDYTFKSNNGYNMRMKCLVNQITVEIQAHSSELTKWSGSVDFDITVDS